MAADDALLVRRCLRNDPRAAEEFVERFQGDVYGLCLAMLRNRHDAEDVAQEVFLRAFRGLRGWDPDRPLKPWIMVIAANRCRTWLSQRTRRPELADYLQETASAPRADDSAELAQEIQAALADLREDYRTVFVLFHQQGQLYEEIALAVGRPVGTVKTWLHRARLEVLRRLRQRGMVPEAPEVPEVRRGETRREL